MQTSPTQQPVIRNYRGQSRRAAEEAYRVDAAQAAGAHWYPVAHRWADQWDGHTLSVVFEFRAVDQAVAVAAVAALAADAPAEASPVADEPTIGASPEAAGAESDAASAAAESWPSDESSAEEWASEAAPDEGPGEGTPQDARAAGEAVAAAEASTQRVAAVLASPDGLASAARVHARLTIQTIDLHCAGEPLRLIRSGFPQVPFAPILERRRWVMENAEPERRAAMHEPRGHRDMYGAILLAPHRPDADIAVLWMHNEGYSPMCGHGIIAVTTGLIEERLYPATLPETVIRFEVPAGLVTARASVRAAEWGGPEVERVSFSNVPSYLATRDIGIRPDGVQLAGQAAADGMLRVDIAYGGAYYGIVDAADLGLRVVPSQIEALTNAGRAITEQLRRDHQPHHPTEPDLGFIYGTIIVDGDPASSPDGKARDADLRNVTIFADAEVDRSPCGSGTSALLAQRFARGMIAEGGELRNAGITGEVFRGRVDGQTMLGDESAVETSIEGTASVTGYHTFVVDDRDPLAEGFLLR